MKKNTFKYTAVANLKMTKEYHWTALTVIDNAKERTLTYIDHAVSGEKRTCSYEDAEDFHFYLNEIIDSIEFHIGKLALSTITAEEI